jgi:hypothetical protein
VRATHVLAERLAFGHRLVAQGQERAASVESAVDRPHQLC